MDASFFPPQPLAAHHAHYTRHGRFCATKDNNPFGTRYTLSSRSGHIYGRLVKLDICGTHRIDMPEGTFRDFFGAKGVKQGIIPVVVRIDKPYLAIYHSRRKHKTHTNKAHTHTTHKGKKSC